MKDASKSVASCPCAENQKKCISARCVIYFSFALIAHSAFAHQIRITPEMDLSYVWAQYSYATNQIARGMFREAEDRIRWADEKASLRLAELDKRRASGAPLRAFVSRIQDIRDRFDNNWTNAVYEIFALEAPLKDFVATNNAIKGRLDWRLDSFQRLRKEFEEGNRLDAETNLRLLQQNLEWEVEAVESLKSCDEGFRAALGKLESARERLAIERVKPLDVKRALRIARDYYEETRNMIAGSHGSFAGADTPCNAARAYLQDIRRTGALEKEVDELWEALDEAAREANRAGVRYYMEKAREALKKRNPDMAKSNAGIAERGYVSRLRGDPAYDGYLAEIKALKSAAEQIGVEQRREREQSEIRKLREKTGFANAPILGEVILGPEGMSDAELMRFAEETDMAAVLKREFSFDNMDIAIDRGGGGAFIVFPNDPDYIPTIRTAFQQSFNTIFPTSFPDGEHFCLSIHPNCRATGEYGIFYAREWQTKDGCTIREIVPRVRTLNVIRTSARPDDAYLYFTGRVKSLFKPGGRTVLIPGLGAYLAKKRPPVNKTDRSGWVSVDWGGKR